MIRAALWFPVILFALTALGAPVAHGQSDRYMAVQMSDRLPGPPENWTVVRSERDWERRGATARRIFRAPDGRTVSVVYEANTMGIMYRHDYLDDPETARRYGYEVVAYEEQPVLVRNVGERAEMRFWINERILILIVGKASREELESFFALIDREDLAKLVE